MIFEYTYNKFPFSSRHGYCVGHLQVRKAMQQLFIVVCDMYIFVMVMYHSYCILKYSHFEL